MMRCMGSAVSRGCGARIAELRERSKGLAALGGLRFLGRRQVHHLGSQWLAENAFGEEPHEFNAS